MNNEPTAPPTKITLTPAAQLVQHLQNSKAFNSVYDVRFDVKEVGATTVIFLNRNNKNHQNERTNSTERSY